jgi:hypothetical protein
MFEIPTHKYVNPGNRRHGNMLCIYPLRLAQNTLCLISFDAILRKLAFSTGSTPELSGGTRSRPSAYAN